MMGKKAANRRELVERWRAIEEQEEDNDHGIRDGSGLNRIQQLKERWFSDAYNFLISSPLECHIWCGSWEIMGPLLETFYNYFKVNSSDSPLKVLWLRMSREMRRCTQCISQHHRAQDMYRSDYESCVISPLLCILQSLDEERVSLHLKELNARTISGEYDPECENTEVVSLMFEVLSFPVLLEDKSVASEFQSFIEAVDRAHELTLAKQQRFPGLYALLFLKNRRARSIGLRLAATMEKIRSEVDLEPLQPLLKKCIGFLTNESALCSSDLLRPRSELDRMTAWIGIKALLGFLEPGALEEGILERYPIFINFVLDHISDDSPEFSHAVNCMRQLFEVLGCKLWLRTPLSPSVICNSLLSQCFHTRNEKIHKDIFDLFYPLLISLEALQDGELEKRRRHFLYFLLHQVTTSSNFSGLTRKRACQIALQIVQRGYEMNPPCPPSECAHMWGPTLVSALKDQDLHSSLRQPALDLVQTIIVSDAAALICSTIYLRSNDSVDLREENNDFFPCCSIESDETDSSCWSAFELQRDNIGQNYSDWLCVPMLWVDVLVHINPTILPLPFSKAVIWALSRFSIIESENSAKVLLPANSYTSFIAPEITAYLGWRTPTGSDDGGDGKEYVNSVRVAMMLNPLIKTFRRLADHFTANLELMELWKQWTWETKMGESLILLIADHNDNARQFGRRILEHVSKTRGLTCGLQFLCSSKCSLSAILSGLRHALKLVRLDSVLINFQTLHHLFFVLCKIFKEGFSHDQNVYGDSSNESNKLYSHGGFLLQPTLSSLPVCDTWSPPKVSKSFWQDFTFELAKDAWLSIKMSLLKGKTLVDFKIYQMTNVRLLEILPIVISNLIASGEICGKPKMIINDFSWLVDLVEWGKSSLQVVIRYWKQSFVSLLDLMKPLFFDKLSGIILAMEKTISCDTLSVESLAEQVLQFSKSLSNIQSEDSDKFMARQRDTDEGMFTNWKSSSPDVGKSKGIREADEIIILSDDETPNPASSLDNILSAGSDKRSSPPMTVKHVLETGNLKKAPEVLVEKVGSDASPLISKPNGTYLSGHVKKISHEVGTSANLMKSIEEQVSTDDVLSTSKVDESREKVSIDDLLSTSKVDESSKGTLRGKTTKSTNSDNASTMAPSAKVKILKALVSNSEDDPLECALKTAGHKQPLLSKRSFCVPKRRVIQLNAPVDAIPGYSRKQEVGAQRFKPPRLDDWFKRILQLDYFSITGLTCASEDERKTCHELNEVPVNFVSPEQYVEIFRPLVLEEFKAQLCSSYQELSSLQEMFVGGLSVVSVERIDDFHFIRCIQDDNQSSASSSCSENDLILMTKRPLQNSPQSIHLVGKVEKRERDSKRRMNILVIRVYLQACFSRLNQARKLLLERSKWFFGRIMNITPQLREFQALSSISLIPVHPAILRPASYAPSHKNSRRTDLSRLSRPMSNALGSTYNDSQLQAIGAVAELSDSKNFELHLVQGPPGTGKTRTIVAIISALLASSSPSLDVVNSKSSSDMTSRTRVSQSVAIARAWQDAALAKQLSDEVMNFRQAKTSTRKRRILVCAQSNAAVDELVSRLACQGIYGVEGKMCKPYIVRVGNAKTVHVNSLPFFIDTLVENRLVEEKLKLDDGENAATFRSSLERIVDEIRLFEAKRANLKEEGSDTDGDIKNDIPATADGKKLSAVGLGTKLRILYKQKKEVYMKLAKAQAEEKRNNEELKELRNKIRRSILKEAEIVATTLSGCGGDLYAVCSESARGNRMGYTSEQNLFDAVIIDEAAQALEPATLIPLQLLKSGDTKCIMVGDPKQLPATVLSNVATKYLYQCSMFERLQRAGQPVIMLTEQYRMHPEISSFPSAHFYDGKLLNGALLSSKVAPFHEYKGLGPYVFYDVTDGQHTCGKNSGAFSLYNEREADVAVEILRFLMDRYPSELSGGRIGIITPYKCQLSYLRSRLSVEFGPSVTSDIEFNTIDGFQGREVDILLLSTVRASNPCSSAAKSESTSLGFVADVRRMNVALTRARLSLWILGNARTLQTNCDWAALLKDAKRRDLIMSVKRPYKSLFKTTSGTYSENPGQVSAKRIYHEQGEKISVSSLRNENAAGRTREVRSGSSVPRALPSKTNHKDRNMISRTRDDIQVKNNEKTVNTAEADRADGRNSRNKTSEVEVSRGPCHQNSVPGRSNPSLQSKRPNSTPVEGSKNEYKDPQVKRPHKESNVPKALVSRRKQREAVDALLSSALVSSKKSLPQKRPHSPGI